MDRVIHWIDSLIDDGTVDEAVIQAATFGDRPRHAKAIGVVGVDEFERMMEAATRVVTHGGPGTILQALALGRQPIVVPRDPRLGEHVDGHQQRFVAWLAGRRDIVPVATFDELRDALARPEDRVGRLAADLAAVARVRRIIHGSEAD
jgi:UDP-N-acetylglucosamine transferase subunit ALG13